MVHKLRVGSMRGLFHAHEHQDERPRPPAPLPEFAAFELDESKFNAAPPSARTRCARDAFLMCVC